MSTSLHAQKTNNQTAVRSTILPSAMFAFVAAVTGTVVGFVAALAVAMPMVHQALATEASGLNAKLASSVTPDSCAVSAPAGAVLGSATVANSPSAPSHVQPPVNQSNSNTFIKKFVGGQLANTTAVVKDTGPYSSNEVVTKNTSITKVNNTNDIQISSTNDQSATSGDAKASSNTTVGSVASGDAENNNATSVAVTVNN